MPFRFGIVTLTECPYLFCRALLEVDGRRTWGIAADVLPNKWFTKDPATSYRDDIADMLKIITGACEIAVAGGMHENVFDLWQRTYQAQQAWAGGWGYPPLLAGFGASLVERAMIDAFCRDQDVPFSRVLRENRLGIRLGRIHEELSGANPSDLLPPEALRQITARHTVGLTDPLTDSDIAANDRVNDGLPQSLEACIRANGLTYFKIKLWGDVAKDSARVREVARIIRENAGAHFAFTLDGNENFKAVEPFREFWSSLTGDPALADFLKGLIFVEQPLHRSVALNENAMREFAAWKQRPPTIIDESDATLSSARQAVDFGYAGTSHKNCKGVIKGIANACLLEHRRRADHSRPYILSAEDLTNVGPVALMQDLCVVANLGIPHAERNGHHYFKGLGMFPIKVQEAVLDAHPDLYCRREGNIVAVDMARGVMNVGSVVDNAFGVAAQFDPTQFTPAGEWTYESLIA
jgi:L-alanine-DL-glutamate epimerase-like enolase superfamily enzyme